MKTGNAIRKRKDIDIYCRSFRIIIRVYEETYLKSILIKMFLLPKTRFGLNKWLSWDIKNCIVHSLRFIIHTIISCLHILWDTMMNIKDFIISRIIRSQNHGQDFHWWLRSIRYQMRDISGIWKWVKKKRYIGCCIQCQEILVVIVAAIWEENTTVIHQRKRSGSIIKFLNNINKGRRSNDCTGIL